MARSNAALGTVVGVGLLIAAVAIIDYKLKHPKCQHCGLALDAIKLAQTTLCPKCGDVLTGIQAVLT